jgi:predicted lipoprotein with Yx(FWY)xxD motif
MTVMGMQKLGSAAAVAALGIVLAGCGSSSSGGNTTVTTGSSAPVAVSAGNGASTLKTHSTSIGTVLVDSSGHTVYELAGDTAGHELCNSSCQAFWPPVESGGSIMVVNGHPAFTFSEDSAAGQTHGQGVKDTWGTWFALDANGNPIGAANKTAPAPSKPAGSPSKSSSGGGGYGY